MAYTMKTSQKIVCLGGGIGTVNLIRGLKGHTSEITVVVSAADNGGSAGRLRRLFGIFPPGDAVSCLAALMPKGNGQLSKLLTYRFPGNRYAGDGQLAGQKLGNLLFVGAKEVTGDVQSALLLLEKLFQTCGKVLPSTIEDLSISAVTVDGIRVEGEQKIDLGQYRGKRILERLSIQPENPTVLPEVISAIMDADCIIAGPGDLYTTILPVLLIPAIRDAVVLSKAHKTYIVNVANKPFETKGYDINHYVAAVKKHIGQFPFQAIIANNNFSHQIPKKFKYKYVTLTANEVDGNSLILADIVDAKFPIYHDSKKLARVVLHNI